MVTIKSLCGQALQTAKWRGHTPTRGKRLHSHALAYDCKCCLASMYVNEKPAPNGIEISGTMVALNCPIIPAASSAPRGR